MTESDKSRDDFLVQDSIPSGAVPLELILCTEELHHRPSRPPQYEKENRALVALAGGLADSPRTTLQRLAETIQDITQCDSAGLSLLTIDGKTPDVCGKRFYWPAITGMWNPHVGGGTPRSFGPCGDVLDQNRTLLFRHFERRYPYLLPVIPAAEECLLVPFYVAGKAVGTIWAIMHSDRRRFDAEDDRVMGSLGQFASSAYQALASLNDLAFQVAEREKAERLARELANGLDTQVRVRTQELERSTRELLETNKELERQIAERKRAEEELRGSEAYLAEAQKLSRTGSFGWSVAIDEHYWSDETFRIFEYDPSTKVTLQLILERVHPQDLQLVKQAIAPAAEGKDLDFEYRLLMPSGSVKHVHVVAHAISSKSGNCEYVGAVMDFTATRRAEEAVRRGQAELAHVSRVATLGELTASIAHEVNQPLTAVVNNANACLGLLPDSAPQLQEVRTALAEIVDDADRASAVIARVRQLVRKVPFASTLLNFRDVITDVLALARYESAAQHVTIRTDLTEDLPPVMGDRVQLQQVMLNLIVNGMDAMKATEETKRILTICGRREIRDEKPEALLSVQDTGIGLKLDEMDRLFEAFFTTKLQGMGMGLAISRSIIEAHGGRLWAGSNQGAGATFLFSLPAAGNTTA